MGTHKTLLPPSQGKSVLSLALGLQRRFGLRQVSAGNKARLVPCRNSTRPVRCSIPTPNAHPIWSGNTATNSSSLQYSHSKCTSHLEWGYCNELQFVTVFPYITACDTGPVGRQLNQKGALAALGRALRARPWGGDLSRILNVQYISKVLGFARVPKPSLNVPGEWDSGPSNKGNLGLGSATFSKCMWIFLMCHNGYFSLSKRARRQSW